MTLNGPDDRFQRLELSADAARALAENNLLRDLDRAGHPHLLIKVPDLGQAHQADVGIELEKGSDGSIIFSVLLYDIPSEPVSYDLKFSPLRTDDLRYLRSFLESARFRLYPCAWDGAQWLMGSPQTLEIPTNVLLRLRHYAKDWPGQDKDWPCRPEPCAPEPATGGEQAAQGRSLDPRDTVIRKLKEQVQALRDQLQDRDKRIIELEDELHEIKSRGRPYKLSGEKKPWWPFS